MKQKNTVPVRNPENTETMYRGMILPLGERTLEILNVRGPVLLDKGQEGIYKGAADGIHVTSDIKTARLYADAGSFIKQQKSKYTSRDHNNWTVGIVYELNNKSNRLDAEIAKPQGLFAKVDKFISHSILGCTEFVIPEPKESTPKEIYLFRGDILHAMFNDQEAALTALTGHLKFLEAVRDGKLGGGKFIEQQLSVKIDRRMSTFDQEGFFSALKETLSSKKHNHLDKIR